MDKVRALRKLIVKASANLSDTEAESAPELYPMWDSTAAYTAGERVQYDGATYKVLQAHTAQSDWTPTAAVSLFAKVLGETIAEWVQPGSTNPYKTGDKVTYNGKIYQSTIDNNVWSPTAYPQGWKEVE